MAKLLYGYGLVIDALVFMAVVDRLQTITTNETIYLAVLVIPYQLMTYFMSQTQCIFILLHFYLSRV